ncbi:MAG: diaminopimelate dehydrogenase [Acidobacteriota bacterium]
MDKLKIAIVGYGNVGRSALEAISQEPDMEVVGVVRRKHSVGGEQPAELSRIKIAADIKELGHVDVAVLCGPTRSIKETATEILKLGINTVDSFDIHGEIPALRRDLGAVAREHKAVSIISAGWDPGINSVIRGWFLAMAPKGITYTNYGPGMSMGHTVAVKAVKGVKNALSITVPAGMGIHRRMVYVELESGALFEDVEKMIKQDPYFIKDRTYVTQVENIENLIDMGHGVLMERKGVSGITQNQMMKFELKVNNPALTAQVMVSSARATMKQKPGCYTMIEIPVVDYLCGDVDNFVKSLV